MFLADIAHSASPFSSQTGLALAADADTVAGVDDHLAGTYDDELLGEHFMAGDGRVNENIALTAVHHVFHAEHNRLVDHIKAVILETASTGDVSFLNQWLTTTVGAVPADLSTLVWDGERVFQAARFGTEMQYQHLVFEEFARKVQPQVDVFLAEGQGYDTTIDASIVAEFAHTVYRFGHSMLVDDVDRFDPTFQQDTGLTLIQAFLNPLAFDANGALTAEQAAGAIARGTTRQAANEIDEFKTEALRNNLLGLPLDLAAINLARGRETGIPSLNAARAQFYEWTGDSQLKPYTSWIDFSQHLRHPESVINFIAAYGTHSLIASQTTLEGKRAAAFAIVMGVAVTLSNGATSSRPWTACFPQRPGGGHRCQRYRLLDRRPGREADAVRRPARIDLQLRVRESAREAAERRPLLLPGAHRRPQLPHRAREQLVRQADHGEHRRHASAGRRVLDAGLHPRGRPDAAVHGLGLDGRDDPTDEDGNALVIRDNPNTVAPDPNYLQYTGEDHVVLGGTAGNDTLISSIGDDTLYGDAGNDRLEGGDGVDMILGGSGDDIITDLGGEDNLQGGDGNDAIHGGNSIDLIIGGFGNDFIVNGEDGDETFGGVGNDFILGDAGDEMVFGNEGDDWIEGGMADGSAGENFDTRGLDSIIGNDVFMGTSTIDRMNGEGGDDIMVGSKGGPVDRYIGGSGFDWAVFQGDDLAANADLNLRAFDETPVPLSAASTLARFELVEGLSGSALQRHPARRRCRRGGDRQLRRQGQRAHQHRAHR